MSAETIFFIEITALFAIQGLVSAYVFCDARRREMNPYIWTVISLVVPILIGLAIYLFIRKENEKNYWKGILAIVVSLVLLSGTVMIPRAIASTFATTDEMDSASYDAMQHGASAEGFFVEVGPTQHAQCAVYTWGGAVIDEGGYLWLWDSTTMIAENTGIGNLKAIAQIENWPTRVYVLSCTGVVGYIEVSEMSYINDDGILIVDGYSNIGDTVWLYNPTKVVHIYSDGLGCYIVDALGRIGYYDYMDSYAIIEDSIGFVTIQHVNGGIFGQGTDGNYYGFGNDVFGVHTPNTEASNEITMAELVFDGTNLEDVRVFGVTGSSNAMFAELYAGQNLHVYNNAGAEVCSLSGCMALYSGYDALYAIDINGDLYAYGEHSSGAPLYSGTSVYEETPSPWLLAEGLGSNVRSIGIGGWDVALVLEDGSVRTWGQDDGDGYSDCYVTDETGNKYFLDSYEPTVMAEETNSEFCEHVFIVEETIAATDTEYGLLTYKCNMCGLNYTVQTLPIS